MVVGVVVTYQICPALSMGFHRYRVAVGGVGGFVFIGAVVVLAVVAMVVVSVVVGVVVVVVVV